MWKGFVRRAGAAGRYVSSLTQLFEPKDRTSRAKYNTSGNLHEGKQDEDSDSGSNQVTDDNDSDSISTKSADDAGPKVYQFGSDTGLQKSFSFNQSQTYDEKGIDQKQVKLDEPLPSKVVRRSYPNGSYKKRRRDCYFDTKRKRNMEDTDSEAEEGQEVYADTSDYFSGDRLFQQTEDGRLDKTKSAPNLTGQMEPCTTHNIGLVKNSTIGTAPNLTGQMGPCTTYNIGLVKNSTIGTENTRIVKSKEGDLRAPSESSMKKRVKERTKMVLKCQTVPGVETESFLALKAKISKRPKFAVLTGRGSNFNARKLLKDTYEKSLSRGKGPKAYILDKSEEWTVVDKRHKSFVLIPCICEDVDTDRSRFLEWKKAIKAKILPVLKENDNITVVVTADPETVKSNSVFDTDVQLQGSVIHTPSYQLSTKVREELIRHEMEKNGVSVCETKGNHNDHSQCISSKHIEYIVQQTSNLLFAQRVADFFSQYPGEEVVDYFSRPNPGFVQIIKTLEPCDLLAALALWAFRGRLSENEIERHRRMNFTLESHFRSSMSTIPQNVRSLVLKTLMNFAKEIGEQKDMWDTIESRLRRMTGTIVTQYNGVYCFDGLSMQYAFLICAPIPMDVIIAYCDDWFLYNLILPQALKTDKGGFVYLGRSASSAKEALFKRLLEKIKDGEVKKAWSHRMLEERWFCDEFLIFLKQESGRLSKYILQSDRREAYNILYFGMERKFRIADAQASANITELVLLHPSYTKWRKKSYYKEVKDALEEAALKHAVELERVSTIQLFLQMGVQVKDEFLLIATETRNLQIVEVLLRAQQRKDNKLSFKVKCKALHRSLELYSESNRGEIEKEIFTVLASYADINYCRNDIEPLVIIATRRCDMAMLDLLTTYHIQEDLECPQPWVEDTCAVKKSISVNQLKDKYQRRSVEKVDLNLVTKSGKTALIISVKNQTHEVTKFLLDRGADQRVQTRRNMELPIMIAIQKDDIQGLELLLDNDPSIINEATKNTNRPLHEAVAEESLGCLKHILSLGKVLQIDAVNGQNETALHRAVSYGKDGIVDMLLQSGADLQVEDIDGNTPLDVAVKLKNIYCAERILKTAKKRNVAPNERVLFDAIERNDQQILKILLQCGYDINCQNRNIETPLIRAIQMGNYDLVKFLLNKGANREVKRQGIPLIQLALEYQDLELLQLLLKFGTNISSINENTGNTILHLAVSAKNLRKVQEILRLDTNGDLIDMPNFRGDRPLHLACRSGNPACVHVLLSFGATPGVFNKDRKTPMMLAENGLKMEVFKQNNRIEEYEMVQKLMQKRAIGPL